MEAVATFTPLETSETFHDRIMSVQGFMATMEQAECPVKHHFAPGTYAREVFLAKGLVVVGKIHRKAHLNIVSKGILTVCTEDGIKLIDASEHPVTFCSPAGVKRIAQIHEDTVWTTVHLTDKTDLEEIEAEMIAPSFEALGFDAVSSIGGPE